MMIKLLIFVFFFALIATGILRRYALNKNVLDIPNNRSSHKIPTPRGGGLAIVISLFIILPFVYHCGMLTHEEIIGLGFAGGMIALIGWRDDHKSMPVLYRFIGYFIASVWALYWFGGMPAINLFGWILPIGVTSNILAVLYLAWLINLYNFMDGIDSLAAIEAIIVCIGAAILYWLANNYFLMGLPLLLAAAVAGFLCWNTPPARIFMGDVGSCFLGFMLGGLSIHAAIINPTFFWSWLIFLAVFITDATLTLFRRLISGKRLDQAHCTHAYQHAARKFKHGPVVIIILFINIIWLYPLAILVGLDFINPFLGILIAYVPLIILAIKFNAGIGIL